MTKITAAGVIIRWFLAIALIVGVYIEAGICTGLFALLLFMSSEATCAMIRYLGGRVDRADTRMDAWVRILDESPIPPPRKPGT